MQAVFFSYFDDDPERPMRYLESMDSVRQIGWPSFMDGDILFIATHTPSERYPLAKEAHIADSGTDVAVWLVAVPLFVGNARSSSSKRNKMASPPLRL